MSETADNTANESIRLSIMHQVSDVAQAEIEKKIEDNKKDVREGKSGFFAQIILMITEFLDRLLGGNSITNWVAGISGNPIPSAEEIKIAADETGKAVSAALLDKEFTYKNRDEFVAGISERISNQLAASRGDRLASFDDAKIAELARTAAESVGEKFAGTFDKEGNTIATPLNLPPAHRLAAQQFTERTEAALQADPERRGKLAALVGKDALDSADIALIGAVLAPTLAKYGSEEGKAALKAEGSTAFGKVATELQMALVANKGMLNGTGGMQIGNARLTALADVLGETLVKETGMAPPKEFVIGMETRKQAAIDEFIQGMVSRKVHAQIKEQSVAGLLGIYDKDWVVWTAVSGKTARTAKEYFDKNDKGEYTRNSKPDENGRLKKAEDVLYQFAVDHGKTLNDAQREYVGTLVGQATLAALHMPDLPKDAKMAAAVIERNIRDTLTENAEQIDKLNPVATVTAMNKTMFADIAREFSDQIKNNADNAYDRLAKLHTELSGAKVAVTASRNNITPNSDPSVRGGDDAAYIAAATGRADGSTVVASR